MKFFQHFLKAIGTRGQSETKGKGRRGLEGDRKIARNLREQKLKRNLKEANLPFGTVDAWPKCQRKKSKRGKKETEETDNEQPTGR